MVNLKRRHRFFQRTIWRQPQAQCQDALSEAFPGEMINLIVEKIADSATLNALSQVSKSWEQYVTRRLYEVVVIDDGNLWYFGRGKLLINGQYDWVGSNNTKFQYTKTLELRAHPQPANFNYYDLIDVHEAIVHVLPSIVSHARHLERFTCHFWGLPDNYANTLNLPRATMKHFSGQNMTVSRHLNGLLRLDLVNIYMQAHHQPSFMANVRLVAEAIRDCPDLEYLHLSLKHASYFRPVVANGQQHPRQLEIGFFKELCAVYSNVLNARPLQLKTLICGHGVLPIGPNGLDMSLRKGDRWAVPFDNLSNWYLTQFLQLDALETLEIHENARFDMAGGDRQLSNLAQTDPDILNGQHTGAIAWPAVDPRCFPNLKRFGFTDERDDWTAKSRVLLQRAYIKATGSPIDLSRCPHTTQTLEITELTRRKPFAGHKWQPCQRIILGPEEEEQRIVEWYSATDNNNQHTLRKLLCLKGVEELWIMNDAEQSPDRRSNAPDSLNWEDEDVALDSILSSRQMMRSDHHGDREAVLARRQQLQDAFGDFEAGRMEIAARASFVQEDPWTRVPESPCWTFGRKWQAIAEAIAEAAKDHCVSVTVKRVRVGSLLFHLERVFKKGTGRLLKVRPVLMGIREQLAYGFESLDDVADLIYKEKKFTSPQGSYTSLLAHLGGL